MLYRTEMGAPATAPRRTVDAHSLPHLKLSKAARACLGADILDGTVDLQNYTAGLVAKAVGASAGYVIAAQRLTPEQRSMVKQGKRPLVLPRVPPKTVPSTPVPPPPVTVDIRRRLIAIVNEAGGVDAALDLLCAGSVELAA
jgi:hypothetical protein